MTPNRRRELLALVTRADQLVADADQWLRSAENADEWVRAEDLREMLIEMRARMEGI
jgi:hypothetical protein